MYIAIYIVSVLTVYAQQKSDTTFNFPISYTAYPENEGPLILIDEAHNNFHTKDGGFAAFSKLAEQDGYTVRGLKHPLVNFDQLRNCRILVIANPLHTTNVRNWVLPTPSAFTQEEILILMQWVAEGGSLLLIADHMPFAGAVQDLGRAFGFEFLNGFEFTGENSWPPTIFSFDNNGLKRSDVTDGIYEHEKVSGVATFTGSAFTIPEDAVPVLCFSDGHFSLQPDTAWRFNENTSYVNLEGYYQGALLYSGIGKIAVFGEAALFTAQIVNEKTKVGFNSEFAPQNAQFTLNLIHWLDGILEYSGAKNKNE